MYLILYVLVNIFSCLYIFRGHAPGQRECETAIDRVTGAIRELDKAALAAVSQSLPQRTDNTLQVRHAHIDTCLPVEIRNLT